MDSESMYHDDKALYHVRRAMLMQTHYFQFTDAKPQDAPLPAADSMRRVLGLQPTLPQIRVYKARLVKPSQDWGAQPYRAAPDPILSTN